jgi:formylglycine-generating enzyme
MPFSWLVERLAMLFRLAGAAGNKTVLLGGKTVRMLVFMILSLHVVFCLAACPSADLTGDCYVDLEDLAVLAGQWLMGNRIPEDMVPIPAGTFQMGDSFSEAYSDERPVHTVTLSSFYTSKYEITNGQYCEFLNSALSQGLITVSGGVVYKAGSGTSYPYCDTSTFDCFSQIAYSGGAFSVPTKGGRSMSNDPMVDVSWYGAVAYCNWRSQQEGRQLCYNLSTWTCDFGKNGYHLPTEAQWEYAARGGLSGKRFPWGNTITHSQANYYSDSSYSYDISPTRGDHPTWCDGIWPYTSPAGSFPLNGYGLYDMAGNVWEWCNDWHGGYSSSSQTSPTGPTSGTYRVLRGGSWYLGADGCRVAYRGLLRPDYRGYIGGFRVSLDF